MEVFPVFFISSIAKPAAWMEGTFMMMPCFNPSPGFATLLVAINTAATLRNGRVVFARDMATGKASTNCDPVALSVALSRGRRCFCQTVKVPP